MSGLLAALETVIETDPSLVADAKAAALLSSFAIQAAPPVSADMSVDYGAIGALIISRSPSAVRNEATAAVTNAIVHAALAQQGSGSRIAENPRSMHVPGVTSGRADGRPGLEGGEGDIVTASDRKERGPRANRVGSFLLYPEASVTSIYDSNIFATRNDRVDDFISVLAAELQAESTWSKHALKFDAGGELGRYKNNDDEDYADYWAGLEGRIDLGSQANIFGGVRFSHLHESRESPDDINGIEPTTYDDLRTYFGAQHNFGKLSARLGGTYEKFDFNPVETSLGTITNDDRDREIYTAGLWLGYRISQRFLAYVQGAADIRSYELEADEVTFDRDSDGYRVLAGAKIKLSDQLEADIYGGYLEQDYEDARLDNVEGAAFGASLTWNATPLTALAGYVDRTVDETTLTGSAARLSTKAGVEIDHVLGLRSRLNTKLSYDHGDYRGIERDDDVVNASATLKYFVGRHLFVDLGYRFRHLHSTEIFEDYDRHQLFLRLGGQTYAADVDSRAWLNRDNRPIGPAVFAGPYAGLRVGYGALNTDVVGPRGPVGELVNSDFGGDGATWGLFGGYGMVFGHSFLGLELEGEASAIDWAFTRGDDVREFSVRKRLTWGGNLRAGYIFGSRALTYFLVGVVRTEFITRYALGAGVVDDDFTRTGLRLGAGVEFPLDDYLRLRVDYTYTGYSSYDVDYGAGIDVFDSVENLFRFGFAYRL